MVDAHVGAPPLPATSHKEVLRLAEYLKDDGSISTYGQNRLIDFVSSSIDIAENQGSEQILAFATSAIRSAPNGDETIERIREETGVELNVMSGEDEARVTFLAVRRWFGWSAGSILLMDIGGGSLELASGRDEYPDGHCPCRWAPVACTATSSTRTTCRTRTMSTGCGSTRAS